MPQTTQQKFRYRKLSCPCFVLSLSVLLGCGKEGASAPNQAQQSLLSCGAASAVVDLPILPVNLSKVWLNDLETLPALTELSLTLRENCSEHERAKSTVRSWLPAIVPHFPTPSGLRSTQLILPQAMSLSELASMVQEDPCIDSVGPALRAQPSSAVLVDPLADPLAINQGHLVQIGADEAYRIAGAMKGIKPVVVAVIDTGVDLTHEDLRETLWKNPGEIPANGIDDDRNGYIDDVNGFNFPSNIGSPQYLPAIKGSEHGTHVAGLAVAQAGNGVGGAGVMGFDTRLMSLNVFASTTGAFVADIANAIRYAADNGADIINLSLGGDGQSFDYEMALGYAIKKGVTIVAAAGNEHIAIGVDHFESPAAYASGLSGMLAVASIDTQSEQLSYYSNFGVGTVKLAAPGAENALNGFGLLSTWPEGKYQRIQGTSMASPVVAGAAALAISMFRARGYAPSPSTVIGTLLASAHVNPALKDFVEGSRELSLSSLAAYIDSHYPARIGVAMDPGLPCH